MTRASGLVPLNINNQQSLEIQTMSCGSVQTLAASVLVKELIRLGVKNFILSPGARAIPIVLAINYLRSKHSDTWGKELNLFLVNDERSAGFMAQGSSKAGALSCIICTSGTAVANYLPAVIEAFYSKVSLVVVTTDRPWELHYANSNQTIHQKDIFKDFTAMQLDLPAVDKNLNVHSLLSNINQLVNVAKESSAPVHLNISYRKPFYDADFEFERDLNLEDQSLLKKWWGTSQPYLPITHSSEVRKLIDSKSAARFKKYKNPLIICGPLLDKGVLAKISESLRNSDIPVFADIHSNLRQDKTINSFSLYNLFIEEILDRASLPDVVFFIGDRLISDAVHKFLKNNDLYLVRVSNSSFRDDGIENEFVYPQERITYYSFFEILKDFEISKSDYFENLKLKERSYRHKTSITIGNESSSERSAIFKTIKNCPEKTNIFLSNSLIFREAENFAFDIPNDIMLFGNRGATGIDGIISSAVGTTLSNGNNLLCVLGDQAALHDLTSFSLLKHCPASAMILIINNGGGSIFNLMKKVELSDTLVNPHPFNFRNFSEGFNLEYFKSSDSTDLIEIQKQIFNNNLRAVVEFTADGTESVKKLYNL